MKLYLNIIIHLLVVITVFTIELSVKVVYANANANEDKGIEQNLKVWNPGKVDWSVSVNDSDFKSKKGCEIHWLYDNSVDVMFYANKNDGFFFNLSVKQDANLNPPFSIKAGAAKDAALVIDKVQHSLGVTDINLSSVVVIMALPDISNDLDLLTNASRLLIKMDNTVYNFPLENIKENISYFRECLGGIGVEPIHNNAIQSLPVVDNPPLDKNISFDSFVEKEPLEAVLVNPEKTLNQAIDVEKDSKDIPLIEESSIEGVSESKLAPKQSDKLLEDVVYDGIKPKGEKTVEVKNKELCQNNIFDEGGAEVIQNLTKKLAILEKEKEELRQSVMDSGSNHIIDSIRNCSISEDEVLEEPVDDGIIVKFETTISNLRAENDLLKASLEKTDSLGSGEGGDQVKALKEQVSDLIEKNFELEDQILKNELKSSKEVVKSIVTEDEISEIEKMLNNNANFLDGPMKFNPDEPVKPNLDESVKLNSGESVKPNPDEPVKRNPDEPVKRNPDEPVKPDPYGPVKPDPYGPVKPNPDESVKPNLSVEELITP